MYHPIRDRILIQEIKEADLEEKTKGGIIVPIANKKPALKKYKVIAVGEGMQTDKKFISMPFKKDMIVYIDPMMGTVAYDNEVKDYVIVGMMNIIGVEE